MIFIIVQAQLASDKEIMIPASSMMDFNEAAATEEEKFQCREDEASMQFV